MNIGLRIKGRHMNLKSLACFSFLLLILSSIVYAQDEDIRSSVDYKINKMKTALDLTDSQVVAIEPIIKDYLSKREVILQEVAGEGVVDHVAEKTTLNGLKENEYQKLSKVLSEDQMKKWIDKENLMAALNPDGGESLVDDGPTLSANGADFKF